MNNCFSEGSINRYLKFQIIYKHGILVGEKNYRVTEFQVLPLKQNSILFLIIIIVTRNVKIIWKVIWIEYYLRLNLSSRRYLYPGIHIYIPQHT